MFPISLSDPSQCFLRYYYTRIDDKSFLFASGRTGYECHDAISPRMLERYRARYGDEVTADDVFHCVYGLLHSPEYTSRFAADLRKMIPRVPMVDGFWKFVEAGEELAKLHIGYETVKPWPLDGLPDKSADPKIFRVKKIRFAAKSDRSSIVVNNYIILSGIPEEAYRYEVNGRSAIAWILDRYQVES